MRRKIVKAYNMIYIFLPLPLTVPPTLPYLLATHLPPPLPPSKLRPILHPFCNFLQKESFLPLTYNEYTHE